MADRVTREQQFHNEVYESHARDPLSFLYPDSTAISRKYEQLITADARGKSFLEYGCGLGSKAFLLAQAGGRVTGIDISQFAIAEAVHKAEAMHLAADFKVMNAEQLDFPDASFDVICGSSILHHLALDQAIAEIRRVLKTSGRAVFIEPLAHNPVINGFRMFTPKLRSADEHPLTGDDLAKICAAFGGCSLNYYYLFGLAAFPFQVIGLYRPVSYVLDALDRALFKMFPAARRLSWQVLIELKNSSL